HDVAAARVLDREREAERDREVARPAYRRDPAEARQLEADGVGRARGARADDVAELGQALVEDERPARGPPHLGALLDRRARLLDEQVEAVHGGDDAPRVGLR